MDSERMKEKRAEFQTRAKEFKFAVTNSDSTAELVCEFGSIEEVLHKVELDIYTQAELGIPAPIKIYVMKND